MALSTLFISGKGSHTKVHMIDPEDDGVSHWMAAMCKSKLHRASVYMETAQHFALRERVPCPKCKPHFPQGLMNLLW